MKRLACILLSLIIVCVLGCSAMAVGDTHDFLAFTTNMVEQSVIGWFSTEELRAMATILLTLDFLSEVGEEAGYDPLLFTEPSYVGIKGLDLYVTIRTAKDSILMLYRPSTGEAVYMEMDDYFGDDAYMEAGLREICGVGNYFKNDMLSMLSVYNDLDVVFS